MSEKQEPANVIKLFDSNYRDPSATLRVIADQIDDGAYGDVIDVAIVLNGRNIEIVSTGPHADAGTACLLFNAAIHKFTRPILDR